LQIHILADLVEVIANEAGTLGRLTRRPEDAPPPELYLFDIANAVQMVDVESKAALRREAASLQDEEPCFCGSGRKLLDCHKQRRLTR
jgi:hypothetical protein